MKVNEQKTEFNRRAKESMHAFLRSKTWPEKVESIERMKAMQKVAQESMRKTMAAENAAAGSVDTNVAE